ncbi:MAG: tRNA-uridine aminocarboxypropyltransferase [Acidobacteriota bacterium]
MSTPNVPESADAPETPEEPEVCGTCARPPEVCVCDRIVPFTTKRRVLILQHPREKDEILGSAQILTASLPKAEIKVGLSWRNFGQALGTSHEKPSKWAVLFHDRDVEKTQITSPKGAEVDASSLRGLVVLDGTWSQAKSLWWRNPWLLKLNRISLHPKEPSIYGKLRPEPSRRHVSTLESVAAVLTACGENPEIEPGLRRVFRTLVQRGRDATSGPKTKTGRGNGSGRKANSRQDAPRRDQPKKSGEV